jgi:hypothetical protein
MEPLKYSAHVEVSIKATIFVDGTLTADSRLLLDLEEAKKTALAFVTKALALYEPEVEDGPRSSISYMAPSVGQVQILLDSQKTVAADEAKKAKEAEAVVGCDVD